MKTRICIGALLWVLCTTGEGLAWGAAGHEYVGAVADKLLNSHSTQAVQQILGFSLETASVWPDCVRSVVDTGDGEFRFTPDPNHPEYTANCTAFETPAETARMEDYARRNWDNCEHIPNHGCHESYHFADVAIQHSDYQRSYAGTNEHDIVSAINAAVLVLQDKAAPAPFSIADKKEALFLIAHLVGDLHQPLHVGAVYLVDDGSVVNPDQPGVDAESTKTNGGNSIDDPVSGRNLHSEWDEIPGDIAGEPSPDAISAARALPLSTAPLDQLAALWASDTVTASHQAFAGLTFSAEARYRWTAAFQDRNAYMRMKDDLQKAQLIKGGAHLAELLNAIWPPVSEPGTTTQTSSLSQSAGSNVPAHSGVANSCPFQSGVSRWSIKTSMPNPASAATDVDLASLMLSSNNPPLSKQDKSAIEHQRYGGDLRVAATNGNGVTIHEGDKIRVLGYLQNIGCDPDGDYHIDIATSESSAQCMIVEVSDPSQIQDPGLLNLVQPARDIAEGYRSTGELPRTPMAIEGQLFLDAFHYSTKQPGGGRGKGYCATNVWEIHPITLIASP